LDPPIDKATTQTSKFVGNRGGLQAVDSFTLLSSFRLNVRGRGIQVMGFVMLGSSRRSELWIPFFQCNWCKFQPTHSMQELEGYSPSLPGNFCGTVHSTQIMDLSVVGGVDAKVKNRALASGQNLSRHLGGCVRKFELAII
jgi:hypothetical protein